jgi:hypothetical protein
LIQQELDWSYLVRLGVEHRMIGLLHRHLSTAAKDLVPATTARTIRGLFLENLAWQFQLAGELHPLLTELERAGIPALPYKGPTLAERLYGDLGLRQSYDLDVMVRPADVARARYVLLARGYQPQEELTEAGRSFMLRNRYSEAFEREDTLTVELHWAFTNGDISFPLTLDDLLPRLEIGQLGGMSVRRLRAEDLLLILSVHGAKHLWARFEWICGVAELIRSSEGLNWQEILERARDLGVERMVTLGLVLARDLLDAPVPEEVITQCVTAQPHVLRLAEEVRRLLSAPESSTESAAEYGSLRHDILHFHLRERLRDQMRFLAYRVTTPSQPRNWHAVSVGRWSFPVHSVMRPLQVATKLIPATLWYVRRVRERRASS